MNEYASQRTVLFLVPPVVLSVHRTLFYMYLYCITIVLLTICVLLHHHHQFIRKHKQYNKQVLKCDT